MHYYQHNIGDYRRDTSHLSLLEHGVYRQLMDMYYLSESPIPRETQLVFRRLSARTNDEQKAIEIILSEFFYLTDEGWSHKRCDSEIAVYRDKADTARAIEQEKERVRIEAEKVELDRIAREKDRQHIATINRESMQCFIDGGMTEECAKLAVTLIAKKLIKNVHIKY